MALLLDIDAHGRVIAQGDAARSALADRAGRFVLLPAAADLLVARRTPATDASSARPRCVLAGDLSAFPIADFIAFLQQARLSGTLTVSSGGSDRVVCFQVGEVRSAESSAAGERLGEVAVRLGYVTEAQVADATRTGNAVGKALLELGHLNANDLYKCLHEQVAAVFHALLLCHTGSFALVDEAPPPPLAPLTVSTQSLLMDGIRRIDELSLFRARIAGAGTVLRRRESAKPVTLRPTEAALLALVDGRRTVAEIATGTHLNEFDATKILFHLSEAGLVEALAGAAPARAHRGGRRRARRRAGDRGRGRALRGRRRGARPFGLPGAGHDGRPARLPLLLALPRRRQASAGERRRARPRGAPEARAARGARDGGAVTALPLVTADLPGSGGVVRAVPEDFRVDEVAAYVPTGAGPHVYLRVEKRGLTTRDAVRTLARALGVPERDAGFAGMKDKQAVTSQWLSFPVARDPDPASLASDGLRVLEASRHANKLRTGQDRKST